MVHKDILRWILALFLLHGQFSSLLLSLLNALKEILSLFTLGWPLSLRRRYNDDEVINFGQTFYISSNKLIQRYNDGIIVMTSRSCLNAD